MREDLAKEIIQELLLCSGKLDQSTAMLQGVLDQERFMRYRATVGQIMGTLYVEILRDLFQKYPELEPDSMK